MGDQKVLNEDKKSFSTFSELRDSACLLNKVAQWMISRQDLRAVSLDVEKRRVSFARQSGIGLERESEEEQRELKDLIGSFDEKHLPDCARRIVPDKCETCGEKPALRLPVGIRMVAMPGSILLEKETCVTAPRFWRWQHFPWIHVRQREIKSLEYRDWRIPLFLAAICGLATLVGVFWSRIFATLPDGSLWCYIIAYATGSWFAGQQAWERFRQGALDVHFLMLVVAAGAATIGHWWEGSTLLFLFSLSGALEEFAMGRTQKAIHSLFKQAPKQATLLDMSGKETLIEVEKLQTDMLFRVRPGEQFPVDAEVFEGQSAADESNLTGESIPVEKATGSRVLAGTINLWGRLDCRVLRSVQDSSLNKIIRLITEAQEQKAPSQRFTDKFGTVYTYAILGMSLLMFLIWWLAINYPLSKAFYHTMTLLVVASPCALVLSIPSAILAAIAAGARGGVLFRGGAAIEKLGDVNRVALDKTGTLTTGHLKVTHIESFPPGNEEIVLQVAAALDQNSLHPVARAIVQTARVRGLKLSQVQEFRSVTGQGVQGQLDTASGYARVGKRSLMQDPVWIKNLSPAPIGTTEVLVETLIESEKCHGRILLSDQVRSESAALLQQLRKKGLKVTMLTGDRKASAHAVAEQVKLDEVCAELSPEDKVAKIQAWTQAGERVAMVGDGVNDAPSLAAAHVGVAMGVRGSDAALEQADVVLMQDKLENFLYAYELSFRARKIIQQNVGISLGVIALLVAAALGAKIPLTLGVVGHEGSTVIVVFNSLRLLWRSFKGHKLSDKH